MRRIFFVLDSLTFWTYASWFTTFVVFVGVFGEVVAEITDWVESEQGKKRLNRLSAFILVAGLAGELLTLVTTSVLASREIATLNNETARIQKSVAWRR